jgi:hypothetical protein
MHKVKEEKQSRRNISDVTRRKDGTIEMGRKDKGYDGVWLKMEQVGIVEAEVGSYNKKRGRVVDQKMGYGSV